MPEKTLKDKVEEVRGLIRRFPLTRWTRPVDEALTALEEKIAELEKDNRRLKSVCGQLTRDNIRHTQNAQEAPDGK